MRIGLSAVVVFAGFPVPATKDLISNNGQYKQQERTILILPPHAMPFPCPCLPLSLSQQGATDKVGKWSLDSAEWRGRVVSGWSMEAAWGMGEWRRGREGEGGRNCISGGRPPSPPSRAKLLPLALCARFPVLINLRAALNSHASTGWPGPQRPCTSKSPRVWLSRASEVLSPSVPVAIDHPTANHLLTRSAYTCYGANAD